MLRMRNNHGFHITLHEWTLSIQIGPGNYCENKYLFESFSRPPPVVSSKDAEIAIFPASSGGLIRLLSDEVEGYVPTEQVGRLIGFLAEKPRTEGEIRAELVRIRGVSCEEHVDCKDNAQIGQACLIDRLNSGKVVP